MDNLEMIKIICYAISSLSFGISINTLFVYPFFKKAKASKEYKGKLQAISKYDGYIINESCLLDNGSLADRKEACERDIVQAMKPILDGIVQYVGEENLGLMYTNLKGLQVESLKNSLRLKGWYRPDINRIGFFDIYALLHELIHLSSTYYDKEKNMTESGFYQVNYNDGAEIGRGLNEGFTELISSRIANCKVDVYYWLIRISRLFELFFDNTKDMERFYLEHNLPGFIHYMEEFIPRDKLMDIILRMDKIYYFYNKHVPDFVILDAINLEMEIYGYFMKSKPNQEKVQAFEGILKENKLISLAFKREKMKLVECMTEVINDYENIPEGRKISA